MHSALSRGKMQNRSVYVRLMFVLFLRFRKIYLQFSFLVFTIADGELQTTRYSTLFQRGNVQITFFFSWTYENVLVCGYNWHLIAVLCITGRLFISIVVYLFQSFYKLPLLVSGVDMLVSCKCHVRYTSAVFCIAVGLVLYHCRSRVMIGCYFDRTHVALEKNQLDGRTNRRFGQRGKHRLCHFTKKMQIKSCSITFHLSYRMQHWRMKTLKMATLLLLKREDSRRR